MQLRKQVYIYFLTYFFNAAISFGTVSLLTHHLSARDYGIINLYSSFLIFLTPFISGGILFPLSVEYFKQPENKYKQYFTNAQVIPVISLLLFTILCFVLQQPISHFLKVSSIWVYIIPITIWWLMLNEVTMIITRNKNKPYQFAVFSIGKNLIEMGLTILLVIGLGMAWEGRLMSAVIAPVFMGIISIYLFLRWSLLAREINWHGTKKIFLLSMPFIFERLAVFVLGYSDKYFIDQLDMNGTSEVGLYGLGGQLATIISMVVISMNSAYHPHLFKKLSEGLKGKLHKTTIWYIVACGVTVLGLYAAIPILFRYFIGINFQGARVYAYILSAGYFMWGIYNAFLGYLVYLGKNRQILYISLLGMIVSLVMNSIFVTRYGAEGAAITSVSTYMLMAVFCFFSVKKYYINKG